MKAALAVGLAFALLAGMFAGLSSSAKAQVLSGAYGGDLKVALQDFGGTDPPLDPTAPLIASDRTVLELLYDSLGRIDPTTLAMKPWAATGWTYDTVNKTMTVTLRTDLKFSNGESYNANDVRYSLLQYRTGGVNRWAITVVDTYTLRLNFTTVTVGEAGPGLFFTEFHSAARKGLPRRRLPSHAGRAKHSGACRGFLLGPLPRMLRPYRSLRGTPRRVQPASSPCASRNSGRAISSVVAPSATTTPPSSTTDRGKSSATRRMSCVEASIV